MLDLLVVVSCLVIIFSETVTHYARAAASMALQNEVDRAKRINEEMQETLDVMKNVIAAVKGEAN